MMKKAYFFSIILFVALLSCNPKDNIKPVIDTGLKPYYDSFMMEARARGYTNLNTNITMEFGELPAPTSGIANYQTKIITIDSSFWRENKNHEWMREMVVFHELGHLLLLRDHDRSSLPNGEFRSIMVSGNATLTAPNDIFYRGMRRKYYLDELFNEKIEAIPDWANPNYDPFPLNASNRRLIAGQEFSQTVALNEFLKLYPNVSGQVVENNSLLNVKTQNERDFNISEEKIMAMAGISQDKIEAFRKNKKFEIEIRYRLKSGKINNTFFNRNDPLLLDFMSIDHTSNPSLYLTASLNFVFIIYNSVDFLDSDFNTLRLVRQGEYFAYYLNNKLVHYADVYNPKNYAENRVFSLTSSTKSEFDIDYYRIYERP